MHCIGGLDPAGLLPLPADVPDVGVAMPCDAYHIVVPGRLGYLRDLGHDRGALSHGLPLG